MGDEIMGTLFESDATSLLDSEASHLLTELESMTADPGQPPPRQPPQQTQYYDYGGGNTGIPPQAMQSPASQQMQSPAGSMHSPGGIISPSTPQHFGSPPPQQSNQLQRQMSAPHQFSSYPSHSMQQVASPQANLSSTPPVWRSSAPQPGYPSGPALPQSPQQRALSPGYSMPPQPPQHAGHMPPPGHHSHHGQPSGPMYMSHPTQSPHQLQAKQLPSASPHPPSHDLYRHMSQHPHHMQYRQMSSSYMHHNMGAQHLAASSLQQQQHMMSQQPRMPRPGMPQYGSHVMHSQRLPGPQHGMMGPPQGAQMMGPGSADVPMHQHQHLQSYRHLHQSQMYQQQQQQQAMSQQQQAMSQQQQAMSQQHEMLPPGHYSAMRAQMPPQQPPAVQSASPYGYGSHSISATLPSHSYNIPQSSPQFQMASNHPQSQNTNSLEQLEKMVSPLNQQLPSSPMSGGYPSRSPSLMSPRSQHMPLHPQMSSSAQQEISSPVRASHMMSPQAAPSSLPMQPQIPMQQQQHQQFGVGTPQPQLSNLPQPTPLEQIAKEIEQIEHKLRQLKSRPPSYFPDHEKELRTVEERLRSLQSQQSMMLADVKKAECSDSIIKQQLSPTSISATSSTPTTTTSAMTQPQLSSPEPSGQPPPDTLLQSSVDAAEELTFTDSEIASNLGAPASADSADKVDETATAAAQLMDDDAEDWSAALSAIVGSSDLAEPLPPPSSNSLEDSVSVLSDSGVNISTDIKSNLDNTGSSAVPFFPNLESSGSATPSSNSLSSGQMPAALPLPSDDVTSVPAPPPQQSPARPNSKSEKKTKPKKPKEKTSKASKRKSKSQSGDAMMGQVMPGQPGFPHQLTPGMHVPMHQGVMPPQGMHPPGVMGHGMQQGMGGQMMPGQTVPHQGMGPPGMGPQNMGPPGMGPQGMLPHGVQPIAPHPANQPIMFVQSQAGAPVMMTQPGLPAQPHMSSQMVPATAPAMPFPGAPSQASHPSMPVQPSLQPVMPIVNSQQQLRSIAPRPSPQPVQSSALSSSSSAPTSSTSVNALQNGPVTLAPGSHLPELLEDPDFRMSGSKASSLPGSDAPSVVDSPAMSEASSSTPGRHKKSGKSKASGRKGRKSGPKRPPASLLKLKKRKRKNSDSMSDAELSPGIAHTPDSDVFAHRRSGRVTKRQKYVDDLQLGISDEDDAIERGIEANSGIIMQSQEVQEETPVINQYIVEKIMGTREGTRELEPDEEETKEPGEPKEPAPDTEDSEKPKEEKPVETIKVTEYYVKYKNFSYLHCDWKTQEELEVTDKRINQKIKRYHQKQSQTQSYMLNLMEDDEYFNPEYVEVDRVLAESRFPPPEDSDEQETVYFLIKWRQLPYEDATWELEADVAKNMIAKYLKHVNPPTNFKRVSVPQPNQWKALPQGVTYKGDNQLREYQFEGVNWLTFCYYNRQNCILADEMGLGKTVQSIAFLQAVVDYGIVGPFLVIAPLSTIGNWIREFDTWTDMNVIVYHGSSTSRTMIQEYEMFYKDDSDRRRFDIFKFQCLITTYEVIIQDVELLAQIDWRCCVIDEAHRLKNKNCKLMEGLRCFELEHKVLLSGTPLQNNVEELFSLLNFLEPEQFKSSAEFMAEFGNLQTESQVEKLKAILKPMMLRRLKEDVEKNLAPKEETIIEVELTNIQKKYYRAILEKNFTFLSKGGTTANVPNLMNTMMELRKCCNHPYLIDGAEEQIIQDLRDKRQSVDSDVLTESMIHASGKLVLLDKLLPKLKAGKHKVLIFSQMIRVLDIIEDYLINKKHIYERIDGRIRGNQRQEAIDRFSRPDSDRFVFLLCTRAGGLGINLTAADTCIIYDSDWNPQNDLQAQARCHRIGQKKSVKIYRLICRNTYEREMFDKASLKLGLDKAVLQSMGSGSKGDIANANGPTPLSKQEVEQLLKKGAYGSLMEDDKAGDQFCEEDIDQILQRRTQVITIESVGKGSTFAKASFSSSGARDDIDINDPEFWQKWAKKADVDLNAGKSDLIIAEPRRRKQTKRFGGSHQNAQLEEISDLDSSSDSESEEKKLSGKSLKGGRKGRNRKDDDFEIDDNAPPPGCYARPECFKVEKMLLVYGWGRWTDIVKHGGFRRDLDELDVSNISQAILLYSLQHYKGDDTIKTFIWDLVMPAENGQEKDIRNHQGLAAATPRGRKPKSRTTKKDLGDEEDSMDVGTPSGSQSELSTLDEKILACPINTEMVLSDLGYRKHLIKHSNKVLLRVRMLYYLKQEIIGAEESKVFDNTNWSQIDILNVPKCEGEPPTSWWDKDSDKCLLIGVFKHGYEKYNLVRADSSLLFLTVCGPPDKKALRKEQQVDGDDADKLEEVLNEEDPATPGGARAETPSGTPGGSATALPEDSSVAKYLPFPSSSDLNTRIRRIITAYQKISRRKAEAAAAALEKRNARMERSAALRIRELERAEKKNAKWTRREEADFYKVVSSFGVETTRRGVSDENRTYVWDTFRQLANLGKKDDDMITDYLESFCYMCRKVCNRLTPADEANLPHITVEPISEERASRCLSRIDLLNKIREEILWHDSLTSRLTLCQYSPEIPPWWKPGEHDKDLLIGAAKHGLAHTDQHIQFDSKLCFKNLYIKSQTEGKLRIAHAPSRSSLYTSYSPSTPAHPPPQDTNKPQTEHNSQVADENGAASPADTAAAVSEVKEESADHKPDMPAQSPSPSSKSPADSSQLANGDLHNTKSDVEDEVMDQEGEGKQEGDNSQHMEVKTETPPDGSSVVPGNAEDEYSSHSSVKGADLKHEDMKKEDSCTENKKPLVKEEKMKTFAKSNGIPSYEEELLVPYVWPKDKVVHQRLELVCYCIETGEWPTAAMSKRISGLGVSAVLDTPVGTPDPSRVGTPNHSEYSCAMDNEDEVDSLKLTISRGTTRGRKPKRSRLDLEVDRIARLRDGGDSECSQSASLSLRGTPESFLNGSISNMNLTSEDLLSSFIPPRKKRGRKSKAEKEAEARAAAEATIFSTYKKITELDLEQNARIPMVDIKDGSRINGEDAPLRKDLEAWMRTHPHYMPDVSDMLGSSSSSSQGALAAHSSNGSHSERRKNKSKHSSSELIEDMSSLSGAENVTVIHRETGAKLSGSKAPRLADLNKWLSDNPQYDVEPKWALVMQMILPDHLKNRVHSEKKKRRRDNNDTSSSASSAAAAAGSYAAQMAAAQALMAAAMPGYPMNMSPFASMGLNPASMLAMYGMAGLGATADSSADEEAAKALAAAAATSHHSAFNFSLYNPMLAYSSMLAQGLGMNTAQGYAQALSSAGMFNGLMGLDPSTALAAASAGGEMDVEMAEKLASMSAAGMNLVDMQTNTKLLEELYARTVMGSSLGGEASAAPSTSAVKEPGETSPSVSKHRYKSATVTKPSSSGTKNEGGEELPEDLSIKTKADAETASVTLSNEGRLSRVSDTAEGHVSDGNDNRSTSRTSEHRDSIRSGHSPRPDSKSPKQGDTPSSPQPTSPLLKRPESVNHSHSSNEDQSNQLNKSTPESPS